MTNIIKFTGNKDSDLFEYFEVNGSLGVSSLSGGMLIHRFLETEFFELNDSLFNREELAQFLWAAAYYLDSEKRYMPEGKLIGINYEDET